MPKAFIVTRGRSPVLYWTSNALWSESLKDAAQFDTLADLEAAADRRLQDLPDLSVVLIDNSEQPQPDP